ncbi:MAG: MarR family transcriptional regulator [Mariprofundaceae bacterium]|nr:MarR family transcriptional regulator [Mariprofundaceae bacterium]
MRNIPYPPERIEDGLGFLANQLSFAIRQNIGRECEAAGYRATPEGLGILFLLSRQDGLTQTQISEFLAKDKAAITRLLNALEKEDLVKRSHDKEDRRIVRSYLTPKGKAGIDEIIPAFQAFFVEAFDGVDQDEFDIARKVLQRIIANLKKRGGC